MLLELEWLHRQMDRDLRRRFAPVFVLFEIKTIVLCVRNKAAERAAAIEHLLERSLLSDPLRRALREPSDVRSTVAAATQVLAAHAGELASLEAAYKEEGLRGFEDGLMRGYLAHVAATRLDPTIRAFITSFIDLRNLMILYKHLRWGIAAEDVFIPGGVLAPERFEQAAARKDFTGLDALAREAAGPETLPAAATEGAFETMLLRRLTRRLRQATRDGGPVELLLDYAWRRYVEARNLAVLHHARDVGPEALERELIA